MVDRFKAWPHSAHVTLRRGGALASGGLRLRSPVTVSVLTIAGSDSGGGAGIQADLKTFAAHRVHGLSAISALTAQNTCGVTGVAITDPGFIAEQVDACFADFDIRAVKLGMLANAAVIHAVSDALERQHPVPVVVDPVMVATSGAALLDPAAVVALLDRLLPMAAVLTPNVSGGGDPAAPSHRRYRGHP